MSNFRHRRINPEGDAFGVVATAGQRQSYMVQRAAEGIQEALQDRCAAQTDSPRGGAHVFHVCGLESLHGYSSGNVRLTEPLGPARQHVCNTCGATWW